MLNSFNDDFYNMLKGHVCEKSLRAVKAGELDDPRGRFVGKGYVVACPKDTKEVSAIVKLCHEADVGIVPLAGSTGLVLGQVAHEGPIPLIVSLERMNRIEGVYPSENVMIAQAGAILANLHEAAIAENRLFPLSLASEGSCQIGGNLATNAGGLNVLRYGNARDLCLGIEAVLPDGSIFNGLKRLRKDNTGYDIRNLLIGSEGSLGIITAASLRLFPQITSQAVAFLQVPSPKAALELLELARDYVGEAISAFELISGMSFKFLQETMPDLKPPFRKAPAWSVLIDTGFCASGDDSQIAQARLLKIFERALELGLVKDGVLAQSRAQQDEFWRLRESIPQANKRIGSISSHDVSIPLSSLPDFISQGIQEIGKLGDMRVNCFGHLGDGNLHYNVFPAMGKDRKDYNPLRSKVKEVIHDLVDRYEGSISAEHGVGRLKVDDLEKYSDPSKIKAMRMIKNALDPKGIMNPGAVLKL